MKRALIIEDDPSLSGLWAEYLRAEGIEVEAVMKIKDGMAAFERIPHPDFVILDLRLIDSYSAMETLQFIPKMHAIHPDAKIIVATGYSTPEIEAEAKRLGADGFEEKMTLGKPDGLLAALSGFLSRHAGTGKEAAELNIRVIEEMSKKTQRLQ